MKKNEQENKNYPYYQITPQDLQDPAILNCFRAHRTRGPHSQSPDMTPLLQLIEAAAREGEACVNNDNSHNENSDLAQSKRPKK
jgi:hypothetical protein